MTEEYKVYDYFFLSSLMSHERKDILWTKFLPKPHLGSLGPGKVGMLRWHHEHDASLLKVIFQRVLIQFHFQALLAVVHPSSIYCTAST